jgi:hypothetical protein
MSLGSPLQDHKYAVGMFTLGPVTRRRKPMAPYLKIVKYVLDSCRGVPPFLMMAVIRPGGRSLKPGSKESHRGT